jgi:hypothetical protein
VDHSIALLCVACRGDAVIVGNRQPGQEPQTGFSLFGAMRGKRK